MPELTLLGFCGFAGSGKNHCASLLQSFLHLNYDIDAPIIHFADTLKDFAHALYPLLPMEKSELITRKTYQTLGTLLRNNISPHIFVDALHERVTSQPYPYTYIIADARFPEEFDYILHSNPNSHLFHVTSPGVGPVTLHESELRHRSIIDSTTNEYVHPNITHIDNDLDNPPDFDKLFTDALPHLKEKLDVKHPY